MGDWVGIKPGISNYFAQPKNYFNELIILLDWKDDRLWVPWIWFEKCQLFFWQVYFENFGISERLLIDIHCKLVLSIKNLYWNEFLREATWFKWNTIAGGSVLCLFAINFTSLKKHLQALILNKIDKILWVWWFHKGWFKILLTKVQK